MRSNKDRKLNLGTAFRLTIMNQFVKKNLDVKIHKLCNLAYTEEIQCCVSPLDRVSPLLTSLKPTFFTFPLSAVEMARARAGSHHGPGAAAHQLGSAVATGNSYRECFGR